MKKDILRVLFVILFLGEPGILFLPAVGWPVTRHE